MTSCARDHTVVDAAGDEWPAEALYGHLCAACHGRILWHLEEVAGIVWHMREQIVPDIGGQGGEKVSGSKEQPLPLRADALDDSNDFYLALANWATSHAATMGVRGPEPLLGLIQGGEDSRGFRAGTTADEARWLAEQVVGWLRRYAENIAALPAAADYHDDVVDLVRRYRGRYSLTPRQVTRYSLRPCPVCFSRSVAVWWPDGGLPDVRCETCHHEMPIDWAQIYGRTAA